MRPYEKLNVWVKSIDFVKEMYKITKRFPKNEEYGLISQIKRAAISIPANNAEGAARNTKKEFINFLYISLGSLSELETLIIISKELNFIVEEEFHEIQKYTNEINLMLNGLIKSLKSEKKAF